MYHVPTSDETPAMVSAALSLMLTATDLSDIASALRTASATACRAGDYFADARLSNLRDLFARAAERREVADAHNERTAHTDTPNG